ncbi:hypothetical protein LTR37_003383 [Vermiconidia calcicola]|uniref:Uncharacterized protein n=1 Tax=Vermiconidia calcicola TaxID=1690605 RepID=A0ACC3NQI8_9PEZI|nr:hypothetical protein LTR37_003383 [Vermiconidia calcicola]
MATERQTSFLDLPREIRNKIYDHVFEDSTIKLQSKNRTEPPAILLTCMQIYTKAISPFYRCATFHFEEYSVGNSWVRCLPAKYTSILTQVRFDVGPYLTRTPERIEQRKLKAREAIACLDEFQRLARMRGKALRPDALQVHIELESGRWVWTNDPMSLIEA